MFFSRRRRKLEELQQIIVSLQDDNRRLRLQMEREVERVRNTLSDAIALMADDGEDDGYPDGANGRRGSRLQFSLDRLAVVVMEERNEARRRHDEICRRMAEKRPLEGGGKEFRGPEDARLMLGEITGLLADCRQLHQEMRAVSVRPVTDGVPGVNGENAGVQEPFSQDRILSEFGDLREECLGEIKKLRAGLQDLKKDINARITYAVARLKT